MPINVLAEEDFTPQRDPQAAQRLRRKAALTSDDFDRLRAEQRARAFRIAQVNNARLVQRAKNMLRSAIEHGKPYADFRRALEALFDTRELPRPLLHRMQLVFRQNSQQAYGDAREQVLRSDEVAVAFPYWMYKTVGNGKPGVRNVRPEHAALHNKVFRYDDPFWNHFRPPWDYNCRCTMIALTEGQVRGRRLIVWTYSGGSIRPVADKRPKPIRMNPRAGFGGRADRDIDLGGLDADLRQALEASLGN